MVVIDEERCKGCGLCVEACPHSLLMLGEKEVNKGGYHPVVCVSQSDCTGCALCAEVCPDICIEVYR
ncbi:MAG TPA: 4Fe-4S dicluster domain-containing protein [Thermosulfidibacter takaii]|uniref:4Fe-4S dicluster domain-containing protein n=1 Tax=Thermosulfidibacter takaii TaxID=412593 RepID=A0A7C0Y641_9BACT|nr:4Fe-4S dicluster domain-containing protein [Thermosulfidibacter takaii]